MKPTKRYVQVIHNHGTKSYIIVDNKVPLNLLAIIINNWSNA